MLIEAGADVNVKTKDNYTPLLSALGLAGENDNIIRGQEEIVLTLLAHESIVVVGTIDSASMLHLAASQGMDRATKALLEKKMNPNDPGPQGKEIVTFNYL
jgi:ankyrin repeat protein